jgi:hypothetical protein
MSQESPSPDGLHTCLKSLLGDVVQFSRHASRLRLRSYQEQVALAVVDSVVSGAGRSLVVVFPRQSGKNELQAQLEVYLLALLSASEAGAEMVKVSPTWKPQSLNAMRRLERVLQRNLLLRDAWVKESGYIYRVGSARLAFLSAAPASNVVGATASALLQCDEAQDVLVDKWDKEINPMAASTNATRVFWGTAWTADTLLGRELELARQAEQGDGVRRVFVISADQVRAEAPAYGRFVDGEIARLGRSHPFVRSQYFSEAVDAHGGMFPAARLALMRGSHPPHPAPQPGCLYAFCIDVGGGDEDDLTEGPAAASFSPLPGESPAAASFSPLPGGREDSASFSPLPEGRGAGGEGPSSHDATALTIFHVDLPGLDGALPGLPTYRVVGRAAWCGAGQAELYTHLRAWIEAWEPRQVVIDATGLGAGLAAFLRRSFPAQVRPFVFTRQSKSRLGWGFLGVVESGRFKDHAGEGGPLQALFFTQLSRVEMEILPGPQRGLRWQVPPGARHPASGAPLHDDLVLSAALCAALDDLPWGAAHSAVLPGADPLGGLSGVY